MKEQEIRTKQDKIEQVMSKFDFIKVHNVTRTPIHTLVLRAKTALENAYNQCNTIENKEVVEYLEGDFYISFAYNGGNIWMSLVYKLTEGRTDWNEKDGK